MKTPVRVAVLDGTGPADPHYGDRMRTSFCRQLKAQLGDAARYKRGPQLFGAEVLDEASRAAEWLRAAHARDARTRLVLVGYSRGGSAAIMAAEHLERQRIPVDSLFLFDAVARHCFPHGRVIPANVRVSRHARRCHNRVFTEQYEGTLRDCGWFGGVENPTRPLFGNTGLTWRGNGDHRPAQVFVGSHGALGGVGWRVVREDAACERAVAAWMTAELAAQDLPVTLEGYAPCLTAPATHPSAFERWLTHNLYAFTHEAGEDPYGDTLHAEAQAHAAAGAAPRVGTVVHGATDGGDAS